MSHPSARKALLLTCLLTLSARAGACEEGLVSVRLERANATVLADLGRSAQIDQLLREYEDLEAHFTANAFTRLTEIKAEIRKLRASPSILRLTDDGRPVTITKSLVSGEQVDRMSPDGRFFVVRGLRRENPIRLIESKSGNVVATLRNEISQFMRSLADITFSRDSKFAVLRSNDIVQIMDLDEMKVTATYDLMLMPVDRGDVFYLPKSHAMISFYDGLEPIVLQLEKGSQFRALEFLDDRAPTVVTTTSQSEWAQNTAMAMSANPSPVGYVSPSEKTVVSRVAYLITRAKLEFYDLATRRHQRSVELSESPATLALSTSERLLAVRLPRSGRIEIYDLEKSSTTPRWWIESNDHEAESDQLVFEGEDRLLVTHQERGIVLRYRLD